MAYDPQQLAEAHQNPSLRKLWNSEEDFLLDTADAVQKYAECVSVDPMEICDEMLSYFPEDDELDEIQDMLQEALDDGSKNALKEGVEKALKMLECKQLELNRATESAAQLTTGA